MYREGAKNLTFRTKYTHPPRVTKIGEMDFEILNYRLKSSVRLLIGRKMQLCIRNYSFFTQKICICQIFIVILQRKIERKEQNYDNH